MAYGDIEKNREGFASLEIGDWIRLFIEQGIFYARVKRLGSEGLDLTMQLKDNLTQEFRSYDGFVSYQTVKGFVKANEDEVKKFAESQPVWRRYLEKYIRMSVNGGEARAGKLTEIFEDGIILDPFLEARSDSLELTIGPLYITRGDIKAIIPYSLEKITEDIAKVNREFKEKKEKEKKEDKEKKKD